MSGDTLMVNFRVEREFRQSIDEAAEKAGKSRSTFLRDAVAQAVNRTLQAKAVTEPHPVRATVLEVQKHVDRSLQVDVCKHPRSERRKFSWGSVCGVCGVRL